MSLHRLPSTLFHPPPLLSPPKPSSHLHLPLAAPNAGYLHAEFAGHGASFDLLGDGCVVKLGLDTGSTATVMVPSGLVASYKPKVWHGSAVEVLQTCVEGSEGEVVVRGGVSVGVEVGREGGVWRPEEWGVCDVRGSSDESVQVELVSVDPEGTVEIKYVITLQEDVLGSEMLVTNRSSSSLQLIGSVISHLKVSTPDATFAFGLKGANYTNREPLGSDFSIVPPDIDTKESSGSLSWGEKVLQGILPGWSTTSKKNGSVGAPEEEMEGEEEDDCVPLAAATSKIYTCAPRQFTMVDRGRRNSVIVERRGFEEFYVYSPGSEHEWYGKYSFVCIAPSAMLTPILLGPGEVWCGGQYLHNPNM